MTKPVGEKTDASDEVRLLRERLDHALEAEANYKIVAENSQTGMFIVQKGLVVYANPAITELMGYTREEVLGTPVWDHVHPDDAVWLASYERRRLAGEDVPPHYVARGLTKRGEVRSFDFRANVVQHKGAPAVLLNAVDITDSTRAQQALADSEREYRELVEQISDWVWQVDEHSIYTYASPRSRDLIGYDPEDVVGKSPFDFMLPEEAERVRAQFGPIAEKHEPFAMLRNTIVHRDGRLVTVETSGSPVFVDGTFLGYRGIDRDITERTRSERSLRESREMLRTVMDNIPQFVFWKDINSVYLGCNGNFARAANLDSPDDIIGMTDYDMPWGKTEADSYRDWDRRVMDNDEPQYHISEPQRTADGATVWLDTNKVPMHDSEGRVVGILGTYEDITERKVGEQALQEAEAKYRSLVEETMVGVYLIQDDQFVYANPRMLEIFQATQEDLLGRSPLEFVAPDDRALVAESIRKRMREEVKSVRYGFKALRVDGTPVDVEVHGAVTSYRGRPAIIGSLVDITERKRYVEALQDSEERYRQLFEHSPDMVMLLSGDSGQFIAMNPTVTRILGYAPYEVLGRTPWDISPEFQPDGRRSVDKAREMISKARGPSVRFDWIHKTQSGEPVDCEVSLVSYRFHGENLIQAIVRDVTERKRADEIRRKFEKDVEMQKRLFYRETILSVTGGTLDICDLEDVEPYIEGSVLTLEVEEASQVSPARRDAERFVEEQGITEDRLGQFMIGVGEAITNAIKHGAHGIVHAGSDEKSVWVAISDAGSGIESLILPRAVLLRGFSTKPSLGLGYSIMLEVSDRILLTTGDQGTTVVLIKDKAEHELGFSPDFLPDTWSSIPG